MPELPDVEGFRREVVEHAVGRTIRRVLNDAPTILRNTDARSIDAELTDRMVTAAERHGKWLLVATDEPVVVFHFGMTGSLRWVAPDEQPDRFGRLQCVFDGGTLRFADQRMLGGIWLVADRAEALSIAGPLGPDALELGLDELRRTFAARRGVVKSALLDQRVVAGLGNTLSDEVLWRSRIHPRAKAGELTDGQLRRLARTIRTTTATAARAGRIPRHRGWLAAVRSEQDPSCPRCSTALERTTVAQRTAVWCPSCQPSAGDG